MTQTIAEHQGKPQAKTTLNLNLCTYNAQRTVVDVDTEKPGEPQNIKRVTAKLKDNRGQLMRTQMRDENIHIAG
eukprot:3602705-Pyramimonas_sp.AAC.1